MRIISGTHKGRRISAPKNLPVRPTTDRSKEGLFNILQHRLEFESLTVLDLFSGTGNMSYEFASRGVSKISAVDQNRHCVNFIQKTAGNLELDINTIQSECITFLKKNTSTFSLIFADPPYDWEAEAYLNLLEQAKKRLDDSGIIIFEHSNFIDLSTGDGFDFSRNYGGSVFSFFE
ncbi:RsmD family RNA methyltransferase [Flavobacteriaceae bacterium]|nr:RsmD family RNA methyltransferase [Flavobacteriaceae bacterium]MDC1235633.1 RsmD family RNA methyltransferase [Flavobacteriaceae bacterium]